MHDRDIEAYKKLEAELIEETAKAIFFRDMVDSVVDQHFYDIWEIETEPNASVGEKICERYKQKAIKYLFENDIPIKRILKTV